MYLQNSGVSGKLSRLVLGSLTIADEGEYKCRVDYSQAPTKIDSVTLSILGRTGLHGVIPYVCMCL